ncbi:uncharacterized protein L969DRAFT_87038 [Mixia osmundae IAM 14324]|nr:uncharacterized protein L969DRAFT_87038 [Mixia osmundae IAM 14324]KEI40389.1 hypothetical protein L969DRAFT_87038 [Mixia osmundae IAM 14324]
MDRISQGLPPVKAAPSPSPTSAPRRRPKIRGETLAQFIQRPTVTFPRRFSSTMTHAAIASLGARQPALELDQSARAAVRAAPTTVQAQAAAASALGISFPAIPPLEDPLLGFMTNLIMKDGKKTVARSTVDLMLSTIRLHTHQDPLPLVRLAVERVCPMVRIVSRKKGAKNVLSPVALNERQRVRRGILWLLVASDSKNDKALGRRMAAEVIAILNGNSSALNKRQEAHRSAVLNRSNAR